MSGSPISPARHLSIVWGVALAIITIIEWNSLQRDPMRKEILSPFIQREITVANADTGSYRADFPTPDPGEDSAAGVTYHVEFHFNGPFFLACFFLPVLLFHGGSWLIAWLGRR